MYSDKCIHTPSWVVKFTKVTQPHCCHIAVRLVHTFLLHMVLQHLITCLWWGLLLYLLCTSLEFPQSRRAPQSYLWTTLKSTRFLGSLKTLLLSKVSEKLFLPSQCWSQGPSLWCLSVCLQRLYWIYSPGGHVWFMTHSGRTDNTKA